MIKVQDLTPEIYYRQSRDFQFIGRLYDLVFNSLKTNADIIYNLPLNYDSPDNIADLLALTLGFRPKHQYTAKQLKMLCSVLPLAIKNKGSIKAIEIIANALINAEGCSQALEYDLDDNNKVLNLYLPPEIDDTTMLVDVFDYLLPAGMSCNIIKQLIFNAASSTEVGVTDNITFYKTDNTASTKMVAAENSSAIADVKTNATNINNARSKNTSGIISNTSIAKPNKTNND